MSPAPNEASMVAFTPLRLVIAPSEGQPRTIRDTINERGRSLRREQFIHSVIGHPHFVAHDHSARIGGLQRRPVDVGVGAGAALDRVLLDEAEDGADMVTPLRYTGAAWPVL